MFQDNLKALRKKKGITQEELAARLNVVRQTVSKWEKGLSVPDAELLIKLAEILEVPVSRLLGSKIEAEEQPDALAEQLSRINEQLAIKNRRAKRVWKAIAFIVGGIIAVYVLILILATVFTFSPNRSDTTDSSQSIESIVEKEWGSGAFISAVREYPVPQLLLPNFSAEKFMVSSHNKAFS